MKYEIEFCEEGNKIKFICFITFYKFYATVHIEELPIVPLAEKNVEIIEVNGRNGYLTNDFNCYKSIDYDVTFKMKDITKINQIKQVFNGQGVLKLSNQEAVYYKATVARQIDFTRIIRNYHECVITFKLQPFAYIIDNELITITKSDIIENLTNVYSRPTIKATINRTQANGGNGNIYVNEETISVKDVDTGEIILDCELEECFRLGSDGLYKNMNSHMIGEFVCLEVGDNEINFDGCITKLQITPNFRYL